MRKILALLLVFVMVFSVTACGKDNKTTDDGQKFPEQSATVDGNKENESTDGNKNDETEFAEETETIANIIKTDLFVIPDTDDAVEGDADFAARNPSQVALNFVEAIAKNHYDAAVKAFVMTDHVFADGNDIKFSVPRSDYKTIADHSGKNVSLVVNADMTENNDGKAVVTVEMKDESDKNLETFTVKLEMNANNKWSVVDDSFYCTNFKLEVPGDCTLYIDNVEVSTDLIVGNAGYNELKDLYVLPVIGQAPKMTKVVGGVIDVEKEVLPESNNDESVSLVPDLNEEELAAALAAAENLWESLYNDYVNGVPTSEWLKYFASSAPTSYPSDIFGSFDELTQGSSGYKNINHNITVMQKREDEPCLYIAKDVIVLNFKYQLDWVWDFSLGGPESGRHFSHILLSIEDGEYKIHTLSDPDWFRGNFGFDEW